MTRLSRLAPLLLLAAAISSAAAGQLPVSPSHEWEGSWQLNLKESMFSGAPPKGESRTIEIRGRNMTTRSSGQAADGKPIQFSYSVRLDGEFHPLVGNPDGDSIAIRPVSPRTLEIEVRRRGQRSATAISSVSSYRMTMVRHRLPLSGSPSDDRLVYDRVR